MFSLMRFNQCKPIKRGELDFEVPVYSNTSIVFSREGLRMSLLRYVRVKATLSQVDAVTALVQ